MMGWRFVAGNWNAIAAEGVRRAPDGGAALLEEIDAMTSRLEPLRAFPEGTFPDLDSLWPSVVADLLAAELADLRNRVAAAEAAPAATWQDRARLRSVFAECRTEARILQEALEGAVASRITSGRLSPPASA